jgi:hypothetical protein
MTKAKISEYDAVASNNTDVNGVNIAENCPPSGMNNMGREIMAALKRFQVGSDGDGVTVGGNLVVSGTSTVNTFTAGPVSATTLNTSGAVVFNDAGADVDFRVEGDTDANLLFVDASTDRVGIGTDTPTSQLTLKKTNAGGDGAELRLINSSTTVETATQIVFTNTTSDSSNAAVIKVARTAGGQDFRFSSDGTERARITSAGYFKASNNGSYVNTSGAHHEFLNDSSDNVIMFARNTSASPYGYYVDFTTDPNNATNYVFGANTGGTLIYRIFSNGTTSARSDAKWKKNIETARDGYIDDLARLRVVKYNWHNHEDGTPKEMGLIAQEVEEVFPGLVQEDEEKRDEVRTREIPAVLDEDGNEVEPARTEEYTEQVGTGEYTKSIKFSVFTPMLIKAVQELKAITDTQAQTIATLEARIAALEGQ